jgi:hypothetical protein
VVVFDANSILSGLGTAVSPKGAYFPAPSLGGKDVFATYSQYIGGKMVPCSFCVFNYNSGTMPNDDLLLISTSNDWMVVTGNNAYYQGSGLVMDRKSGSKTQFISGYKFLFAGTDNGRNQKDLFRMKIWDPKTGTVKYDNLPGATSTTDIDTRPTVQLSSGDLLIKG